MEDTGRQWERAGGVVCTEFVQSVQTWAAWTLSVNLEVTAKAQGRRDTCLTSSLATHPLSWHKILADLVLDSHPSRLSFPHFSDLYCSFINYSSWRCASRRTGFTDVVCPSGRVLRAMKDRKWKGRGDWKVYFTQKNTFLYRKPFAKWSNFLLLYVIWGWSQNK